MGAGKTTFVRGAARALGRRRSRSRARRSRSAALRGGRVPVAHLDLHRLGTLADEDPACSTTTSTPRRIAFVEWPEVAEPRAGRARALRVAAASTPGGDRRRIEVAAGDRVLAFDTATAATVVGLSRGDGEPVERRHDPAPGERPGHAEQLLPLCRDALERGRASAGRSVDRIGVGVGPGTFTGPADRRRDRPRAGPGPPARRSPPVSTLARAGAPATASTARSRRARRPPRRGVRRRLRRAARVLAPAAMAPERAGRRWRPGAPDPGWPWATGRYASASGLEAAGVAVPGRRRTLHRVSAGALRRLAADGRAGRRATRSSRTTSAPRTPSPRA